MSKVRRVVVPMILLAAVSSCFSLQPTEQHGPVNPKASTKTQHVLRMLYELPNRPDAEYERVQ